MVKIDHEHEYLTQEERRLAENYRGRSKYWLKWGPYVAERQWATGMCFWPIQPDFIEELLANGYIIVREDYSASKNLPNLVVAEQFLYRELANSRSPKMATPGHVRKPQPHSQSPFQRISNPSADFPHEHARSRTFRWGEDGIAGVSDTHGFQNIAFAFWNEEESVLARL